MTLPASSGGSTTAASCQSTKQLEDFTLYRQDNICNPPDSKPLLQLPPLSTMADGWNAFSPLFALRYLKKLEIEHGRPLLMDDGDIIHLARHCSKLEILNVNSEPRLADDTNVNSNSRRVSLNVLVDLAMLLPEIEQLSLYVDSSTLLLKPLPLNPPRFKNLRTLSFGTSPLRKADWAEIQMFLGRLLPWGCKVVQGPAYLPHRAAHYQEKMMFRKQQWSDLAVGLERILQVRELSEQALHATYNRSLR